MNNEKQTPPTLLDACTLLARETVSLLDWVDAEMENTKRFAEAGEQTESLVKLKTPFAMSAPAMQMDAACILLKSAAQHHPTLRGSSGWGAEEER